MTATQNNRDLRNPLAKARDEWLESDEAKSLIELSTHHGHKHNADDGAEKEYARNRIVRAFLAGANALRATGFSEAFNRVAKDIYLTATNKGWWEGDRNEGELIALMHSELSEALEALRAGNLPSDHIPEFTGVEEEFADVIIRIMDVAAAKGYRVAEALQAKVEFNKSRPYKHGGKKF